MKEFMCPECGTQIITNHSRKKFCCRKCQKNYNARKNNRINNNCGVCNKSLLNKRYAKRFCSNECNLKARNLRREQRAYLKKKYLIEMLGFKCHRCNYNKCIRALQFHHKDPSKKKFVIGENLIYMSLAKLKKEASKCEVLCSNCHFEEHDNWKKFY